MTDIDLPLPAVIHAVQSDNTVILFNRTRAESTVKHIHKFLCAILDLDYGPQGLQYSIVSTDFDIQPWKPSLKEEWKEFWICAEYFYLGEHRAEKTTYLAKNELQWCILILAFLALVSKMQQCNTQMFIWKIFFTLALLIFSHPDQVNKHTYVYINTHTYCFSHALCINDIENQFIFKDLSLFFFF